MENKIGKYLKYAFGEIILVVIGILIALQINIWNTESDNKAKIDNTLKQIQADLLNDIKEITTLQEEYKSYAIVPIEKFLKDTLNSSFSINDYKNLITPTVYTRAFAESNQSYLTLKSQIESIPKEYNTIIFQLNRLYNENLVLLKNVYNNSNLETDNYKSIISRNYDWWEDFRNGKITEEIKEYITSNEHRRRLVINNENSVVYNLNLGIYKSQSILCYLIIKDFIKDTSEVPDVIKKSGVLFPYGNIDDYAGTYEGKYRNYRLVKKYNVLFDMYSKEIVELEGLILREKAKDSLTWLADKSFQLLFKRDSLDQIKGFYFYYSNTDFAEDSDAYFKKKDD